MDQSKLVLSGLAFQVGLIFLVYIIVIYSLNFIKLYYFLLGLYSAILLDSLGIEFEIIEANSEHLGGRAFTYYFSEKKNRSVSTCREFYDYTEMGAMRIPRASQRLLGDYKWSLVNYLNRKLKKKTIKLIDYKLTHENGLYFYNNRKLFYSNKQYGDPLGFSEKLNNGNGVPDTYTSYPFSHWLDMAIQPFLDLMKENTQQSFKFLQKFDNHSVRSFMATFDYNLLINQMNLSKPSLDKLSCGQYPQIVIDWIELLDANTGIS